MQKQKSEIDSFHPESPCDIYLKFTSKETPNNYTNTYDQNAKRTRWISNGKNNAEPNMHFQDKDYFRIETAQHWQGK